ncbi:beta-glucanase/beta-glucan synthetase [Opitutaceae bacterium TAV1]|nr:beta-glucanase/beta-glucan synthetase [Opitutaceae bacterium TAV1]
MRATEDRNKTENGYVLVWNDEFDLAGAPDPVKWGYETGARLRNDEAQFYTTRPENVRVENGCLVIEARKEDWQGARYTSASVTTRDTAPLLYGWIGIRAKIPGGRGLWPALWLLGYNNDKVWWPEIGEIDMMEHVGCEPESLYFTFHTLRNNHAKKNETQAHLSVRNIHDDFHLYTLDWTPQSVALSFDGREVLRMDRSGDTLAEWPFSQPLYLIMNVAVGGQWGGMKGIDDTVFPRRMLIDYVRVYKQAIAP